MIKKAKEFALKAHDQQRYGDKPYIVHLKAVVNHLECYGETAQVVGYLHDVVEDTEVSYNELKELFGKFIADCVAIVTDELGSNRKERKKKTYKKMAKVSGDLALALTVKAADRLANIQACIAGNNNDLLDVYKKEHPNFQRSVYRENLCEEIWQKIEASLNA
ncbi:MAG: HD domain-containing protein [candidate division Zixibacteria bacterium]|nr:HD domain-containing protein [candidate division Zixibacteria bacterium]